MSEIKENEMEILPGSGESGIRPAGDMPGEEPEKKTSLLREVFEWVKILLAAAAVAFLLNSYIIANSTVPTGSMKTTIMGGDRVLGSRLTYRFGEPEKGDVAIFIYGYNCRNKDCPWHAEPYRETKQGVCPGCGREDSKNKVVYYVKRVIGVPGDHIEIRETGRAADGDFKLVKMTSTHGTVPTGTLYVNGEAQEEVYVTDPMIVAGSERFPEVDVTVPEDCYYMLGDNRNDSKDARYWGGNNFVPKEKMLAKVLVRYWPLTRMGGIH